MTKNETIWVKLHKMQKLCFRGNKMLNRTRILKAMFDLSSPAVKISRDIKQKWHFTEM